MVRRLPSATTRPTPTSDPSPPGAPFLRPVYDRPQLPLIPSHVPEPPLLLLLTRYPSRPLTNSVGANRYVKQPLVQAVYDQCQRLC